MRLFDVVIPPERWKAPSVTEGFDVQPAGEDDPRPAIHVGPHAFLLGPELADFLKEAEGRIDPMATSIVRGRIDARLTLQPEHPKDPTGALIRIRVAERGEALRCRLLHPVILRVGASQTPGVRVIQSPTMVRALYRERIALVALLRPHIGIKVRLEYADLLQTEEWLLLWRGGHPEIQQKIGGVTDETASPA